MFIGHILGLFTVSGAKYGNKRLHGIRLVQWISINWNARTPTRTDCWAPTPEFLIQKVWGPTIPYVLLTCYHAMLNLLFLGKYFENNWLSALYCCSLGSML